MTEAEAPLFTEDAAFATAAAQLEAGTIGPHAFWDAAMSFAASRAREQTPVAWRYRTITGWHTTTDADKALRLKVEHGYEVEPLGVIAA